MKTILLFSTLTLLLLSCNSSEEVLSNNEASVSIAGGKCLDNGFALTNKSIKVEFEYPSNASELKIKRDGVIVFSTNANQLNSFIDSNLREGETYTYSCEYIKDNRLFNATTLLEIQTALIGNRPIFDGIQNAAITQIAENSVLVDWYGENISGPVVDHFEIYMGLGTQAQSSESIPVDYSTPVQTTNNESRQFLFENLGDEMKYIFAVRACTADGLCDLNETKKVVTLQNMSGYPQAPQILSYQQLSYGGLKVFTKWNYTNGLVLNRSLECGLKSETTVYNIITNYGIAQSPSSIPNILEITSSEAQPTMLENTLYNCRVKDTDGVNISYSQIIEVLFEDYTPPTIEATLTLGYVSGNEGDRLLLKGLSQNSLGDISQFAIKVLKTQDPELSACDLAQETLIDLPQNSSHLIEGLDERSKYKVCIQALDASGNYSDQIEISTWTLDHTSPVFNISNDTPAFSGENEDSLMKINWAFTNSIPSDLKEFKIFYQSNDNNTDILLKNENNSVIVNPTMPMTILLTGYSAELQITREYAAQKNIGQIQNDKVGKLQSCDNAYEFYSSKLIEINEQPNSFSDNCYAKDLYFHLVDDLNPPKQYKISQYLPQQGVTDNLEDGKISLLFATVDNSLFDEDLNRIVVDVEGTENDIICEYRQTPTESYHFNEETPCVRNRQDYELLTLTEVKAFDTSSNSTNYNPSDISLRTNDTQEPHDVEGLGILNSQLHWYPAFDNSTSYVGHGNSLTYTYKIKASSNENSFNCNENDLLTTGTISSEDLIAGALINVNIEQSVIANIDAQGKNIYANICTQDEAQNESCLYACGEEIPVPLLTLDDGLKPEVFTISKVDNNDGTFRFNIQANDLSNNPDELLVTLRVTDREEDNNDPIQNDEYETIIQSQPITIITSQQIGSFFFDLQTLAGLRSYKYRKGTLYYKIEIEDNNGNLNQYDHNNFSALVNTYDTSIAVDYISRFVNVTVNPSAKVSLKTKNNEDSIRVYNNATCAGESSYQTFENLDQFEQEVQFLVSEETGVYNLSIKVSNPYNEKCIENIDYTKIDLSCDNEFISIATTVESGLSPFCLSQKEEGFNLATVEAAKLVCDNVFAGLNSDVIKNSEYQVVVNELLRTQGNWVNGVLQNTIINGDELLDLDNSSPIIVKPESLLFKDSYIYPKAINGNYLPTGSDINMSSLENSNSFNTIFSKKDFTPNVLGIDNSSTNLGHYTTFQISADQGNRIIRNHMNTLFGTSIVGLDSASEGVKTRCTYTPNYIDLKFHDTSNPETLKLKVTSTITLSNIKFKINSCQGDEIIPTHEGNNNYNLNLSALERGKKDFYLVDGDTCYDVSITYNNELCAPGFAWVGHNYEVGVKHPFCVQRKEFVENNLIKNGVTQSSAISSCNNIGGGYHLISNNQWNAIANEVKNNLNNYGDNGCFKRGLTAATNSQAGCDIFQSGEREISYPESDLDIAQQRFLALQNGETIIDFSGNHFERVLYTDSNNEKRLMTSEERLEYSLFPTSGWREINSVFEIQNIFGVYADKKILGAINGQVTMPNGLEDSIEYMGGAYMYNNNLNKFHLYRGGSVNNNSQWKHGPFTLNQVYGAQNSSHTYAAFRCVKNLN